MANREEKIQLYRGIIQTLGILIMLTATVWMIKNFNERKVMGECVYVYDNGTKEHTGLYGNCNWYEQKMRMIDPEYDKSVWDDEPIIEFEKDSTTTYLINDQFATLQNEDKVNGSNPKEVLDYAN